MLSEIYIKGFKTFARPVRMPLEEGVTAVVGPNGSGKSNVTDAVLFALGEQSPGLLRAGTMGDLIFSGSDTLPASNVAEVTLVMDNESKNISLPYKEVSISRRISRGGETEYRINGSRSRLADVRAVAGEAGLGRHSILRQGAVDAIVAGGAAACRLALEESAGLGVYRRRRLSASRRLEKADTQLEKTRQLEVELAGQLQRIEQEAAAAREYRELESRYRKLSLAYLYKRATRSLDEERRKLVEGENLVSKMEEQEASLQEEEAEIEPRSRALTAELRFQEQYLESLEDFAEDLRSESMRTDRSLFRIEAIRDGGGERDRLFLRLKEELRRVSETLSSMEFEAGEAQDLYEAHRQRLSASETAFSEAADRHAAAENELSRMVSRLDKLRSRREQAAPVENVLSGDEISKLSGATEELERTAENLGNHAGVPGLQQKSEKHRLCLKELDSGLYRRQGKLEASVGKSEATIQSLNVPEEKEGPVLRLDEVIKARPGYELAVEAAIGEFSRGVLARDLEEGIEILSGGERIALRLDAEQAKESGAFPGTALLDCVEILDESYAGAVEKILSGIYVVETPENGSSPNGYVAVTPGGLRLTRTSVSRGAAEEGKFLRQRRLRKELEYLEAVEKDPTQILGRIQEELAEARNRLQDLEHDVDAFRAVATRAGRIASVLTREASRRGEQAIHRKEQAAKREQTLSQLADEISTTERRTAELKTNVDLANAGLAKARVAAAEEREVFDEVERHWKTSSEKLSAGEKRRESISRQIKRMANAPETETVGIAGYASRVVGVSQSLSSSLRERRGRMRERRARINEDQSRLSGQRAKLSQKAVELARNLATARAETARFQENIRNAETSAKAALEEIESEWGASIEVARSEAEELPDNVEPERNKLTRKLKRFGDVNLLALSQEQELRERHEFVVEQRQDAESAATELNRIIQKIDTEIESRFEETFGQVKRAFGEIVPRMLRGASGRLGLTEEGVEVGLRLGRRGWKPLNVLSGGERALLALSFLFSIFISSPGDRQGTFCMLDEAEAALDDVNLARFLAVVDSYRAGGQFILVTHQKRTMAASDVLYGVTQDASGATAVVSKRLSGE